MPRRVLGDPARLRQVLINLIGNAVKFTEERRRRHRGRRRRRRPARSSASPTPASASRRRTVARIFDEFEQANASANRRHGGAGLGLAIAERIVARHGRLDHAGERAGNGSVFSFAVCAAGGDRGRPAARPDLKGKAYLLVSASPVLTPALQTRLAAWGASVVVAASAAIAKAVLPDRDWDAVIVDRALGLDEAKALAAAARPRAARRLVLVTPLERPELADAAGGRVRRLSGQAGAAGLAGRAAAAATCRQRWRHRWSRRRRTPRPTPQAGAETRRAAVDPGGRGQRDQRLPGPRCSSKLGHRVQLVGDGAAAVNAVSEAHASGAPFDLVLMDVQLPGVDGLEATRRIRALGEAGRVRIVALTANAFAEDRDEAEAAGMDGFLTKPLDPLKLKAALAEARPERRDAA